MKGKEMTELQRNNKTAMTTHFVSVLIMLAFIVLQAVGGRASLAYALALVVIGLLPVGIEFFFWKRNPETAVIKHMTAIGFALFYTICLFTAVNQMVFAFVIPMVFVVSIYNDIRYLVIINTGTILESILMVVLGETVGGFGYQGNESGIVQIVIMLMVGGYSLITTKTLRENSRRKIEDITSSQEKAMRLLQTNAELSGTLTEGIDRIHTKMTRLSEASEVTRHAMEQLSEGATDTAAHVQSQSQQTEAIQKRVDDVSSAAEQINDSMQETLRILEDGSRNVALLVADVEASAANGSAVTEKLDALNKYMEEMNSIVELIGGITSQTSLLALNASIEAARAGEAGRGFSVVATEISGMATRTKEATVHITELISNVTAAIGEVVGVITRMVEGIRQEKQGAAHAAESFESIQDNTHAVREHMETLVANVTELREANRRIVDSVQNISAVSEEVAAHANETMEAEKANAVIREEIAEILQELVEMAGK
ncbi:MAG: chemotaxis protein [Lachnospiraceae bacterium]|nr:chemotaxis protein [Lachnospiraceae bacterium]